MKKIKGLILFSGGLDSILAAKILMGQGIKMTALSFKSYFFNESQAKKAAKDLKISLKIVDFSKEHLEMVKRPKYGYGSAMNPCIDCHALMLKRAKKIMEAKNFDFIATGEVVGERPMSQNKIALGIVEIESGLRGYLLRPLSAKLLRPTIPEREGVVDRKKLLDISGRSRKKQIELAKKFKIRRYPTPAGGCLLTDTEFSKRLKGLLEICPKCVGNDIELLKLGRHLPPISLNGGWVKIIVGRNEKEDKKIEKLSKDKDTLIEMKNYPGPLTLVRGYNRGKISKNILELAKRLTQSYSTKAKNKKDVRFLIS